MPVVIAGLRDQQDGMIHFFRGPYSGLIFLEIFGGIYTLTVAGNLEMNMGPG